jgi:CelD/BcsL family acetyltransferase involved in cellulose biosynthesis
MSSAAAVSSSASLPRPGAAAQACRTEVVAGLAGAERIWRAAEAKGGSLSPYQRFDWIAAFTAAVTPDADIRVAIICDAANRPALILPFSVERHLGLRLATAIGGKHANFNLGVAPHAAGSLSPADLHAALRRIAVETGIDAFAFAHVPKAWAGEPNPLAAFGTPSPSDAYEVRLEADPEATAQRSMSNEARKRLRNKERGLAKLGDVAFLQARTEAEVDRLLEAFFRQKEERFRELGIPDPFSGPDVRTFLRNAALAGLAEGRPAIELYGLLVGDRVAAVLGGAADRERLSGMFISFEACKEATKYSPGDILVSRIVREQCLRGRRFFDLGVGEARYKRTFCNDTVELVDVFLPVSRKGSVYALARRGLAGLKRRVKQNPRAMQLVARLRRAKAAA